MNVYRQILSDIVEPAKIWIAENGLDFAGRIVAASVILLIGAIAIMLLAKFLRKFVDKHTGDKVLLERFFVSVGTKAAWVVLLTVVISKLGVNVGPIIAGLGATGFIVGFAFQESLGSLAAGIMIAFNQPFKIGDYVTVAGYEGTVRHLDMMTVTLTTADNRRITIPNKQAWGSAIVNYSAMPIRRVEISVGVSYSSDIGKACAVAIEVLGTIPGVLKDPAPCSLVKALQDSSVLLTFRAWVNNADYWPVTSSATQLIKESYDRAGISIPFPQLDVHVLNKS